MNTIRYIAPLVLSAALVGCGSPQTTNTPEYDAMVLNLDERTEGRSGIENIGNPNCPGLTNAEQRVRARISARYDRVISGYEERIKRSQNAGDLAAAVYWMNEMERPRHVRSGLFGDCQLADIL